MVNLKKWISNNKLLFIIILVLSLMYFNGALLESFTITGPKVKDINNAIDSIIACDKSNKCADSTGIVTNFAQFKKKLKYPKFNVVLFNDLINKRKEKDERLTQEELEFLVKKGKYEDSFGI